MPPSISRRTRQGLLFGVGVTLAAWGALELPNAKQEVAAGSFAQEELEADLKSEQRSPRDWWGRISQDLRDKELGLEPIDWGEVDRKREAEIAEARSAASDRLSKSQRTVSLLQILIVSGLGLIGFALVGLRGEST